MRAASTCKRFRRRRSTIPTGRIRNWVGDVARVANDRVGELGATYPDRFAPMCTVPLQHPEMALAELERCHNEHGMRGVESGTNVEAKS